MKKALYLPCLIILAFLASCQTSSDPCDEVVCETVHRYGVQLDPDDWSERGKNGQVVSMRKDGVTVTRSYDEGTLHGDCTYTFPNREVVQKKEVYNQGALSQEVYHYPSGLPQQQVVHESPQKKSVTAWYESGSPQAREEHAKEGLVQGEYYNANHQIESRVDEANGFRTRRDGLGKLEAIDRIENGQMVESTTYHPDGTLPQSLPMSRESSKGSGARYLPGGEPATVEKWANNVQHGKTTVYEQGEKRAEVPYLNGVRHGVEQRYRNGGEIIAQEITWGEGTQHGPTHTYIGETKQTDWYFQGKKVPNKATFDMFSNR